MKRLLLLLLAVLPAVNAQEQQPLTAQNANCRVYFNLSVASSGAQATPYLPTQSSPPSGSAGTSLVIDNRQAGCYGWTVESHNHGFSALSLAFQSAPDNTGGTAPGTWSTVAVCGGTECLGVNPIVSTGDTVTTTKDPGAWLRVNLTSKTGTGSVSGVLYGWKVNIVANGGAPASACPAGATGEVQYNNAGACAGSAGLRYYPNFSTLQVTKATGSYGPGFSLQGQNADAFTSIINSTGSNADLANLADSTNVISEGGPGGLVLLSASTGGPVRLGAATDYNYALAGEKLRVNSSGVIGIGPFPSISTMDLGFLRLGAGSLEFNTGTPGSLADITVNSCAGCSSSEPTANGTTTGKLASQDWRSFNARLPASYGLFVAGANRLTPLSTLSLSDEAVKHLVLGTDLLPQFTAFDDPSFTNLVYAQCVTFDCSTVATTAVAAGATVNWHLLKLGADGFARIAYTDTTSGLHLIRCLNRDCSSKVATAVPGASGAVSEIAFYLATGDIPWIAYSSASGTISLIKCADADCSAVAHTTTIAIASETAYIQDLEAGATGFPFAVFGSLTAGSTAATAWLAQCPDDTCAAIGTPLLLDTVASPPSVYEYGVLRFTSAGLPRIAIARPATLNTDPQDIILILCSDTTCSSFSTAIPAPATATPIQPHLAFDLSNDIPQLLVQTTTGTSYIICADSVCTTAPATLLPGVYSISQLALVLTGGLPFGLVGVDMRQNPLEAPSQFFSGLLVNAGALNGSPIPANAVGALVNDGSGNYSFVPLPDTSGLSPSLPVFTDGSTNLVSGSVHGLGTALQGSDGSGTPGNLVAYDGNGNVTDSGASPGSFAPALPGNAVGALTNDGMGGLSWQPSGQVPCTFATLGTILTVSGQSCICSNCDLTSGSDNTCASGTGPATATLIGSTNACFQ